MENLQAGDNSPLNQVYSDIDSILSMHNQQVVDNFSKSGVEVMQLEMRETEGDKHDITVNLPTDFLQNPNVNADYNQILANSLSTDTHNLQSLVDGENNKILVLGTQGLFREGVSDSGVLTLRRYFKAGRQ